MDRQGWRGQWNRRGRSLPPRGKGLPRASGAFRPPEPAGQGIPGQVPGWLAQAAGWSWRVLLVGLLVYLAFRAATALRIVVLPCVAALLFTALLQPLARRLRGLGLPNLAATWSTLLLAVAVIAGAGALATTQASADYQVLARDLATTAHQLQGWLSGPPFHVRQVNLEQLSGRLIVFLRQHQAAVAGTVLSGGRLFLEILGGAVLMLFITFFFLKDGEHIWAWLVGFLGSEGRRRAHEAGHAAWQVLVHYVRGTILVAATHAAVIGVTLWLLGVPLLAPLVILVFLAAFVPLVGVLVAGSLAVLVTLGTRGLLAAVVLIVVFVIENQVESHLLQPFVVGRMVRLHPLATILALAVGGVVAGIPGAIVAVPTAAALVRAGPLLAGRQPQPPGRPPAPDQVPAPVQEHGREPGQAVEEAAVAAAAPGEEGADKGCEPTQA